MLKNVLVYITAIILVACAKKPPDPVTSESKVRESTDVAGKLEAAILAEAPFVAAKTYDPEVYNAAIDALHAEANSGASAETMFNGLTRRIMAVEIKRTATAPSVELIAFEKTVNAELRALDIADSVACFNWLFPSQGNRVQLSKYIPKSLIVENHAALAKVIQASVENPQPVPVLADVSSDLQLIQSDLTKRYGEKAGFLVNVNHPTVTREGACVIWRDYREAIMELPEDRAGRLLRYLYSKQSAQ